MNKYKDIVRSHRENTGSQREETLESSKWNMTHHLPRISNSTNSLTSQQNPCSQKQQDSTFSVPREKHCTNDSPEVGEVNPC